jgi:hypothetical protein
MERIECFVVPAEIVQEDSATYLDQRCGRPFDETDRLAPRSERSLVVRLHLACAASSASGVTNVLEDLCTVEGIAQGVRRGECESALIVRLCVFRAPGPLEKKAELK